MKRALLYILPLILIVLAASEYVLACSCLPSAPCSSYGNSDAVFVGKVVGSKQVKTEEEATYPNGYDNEPVYKKVTYAIGETYIEVFEAFKGAKVGERIAIISVENDSACGMRLKRDQAYLIFGRKGKVMAGVQRVSTGLCAGNRELPAADDALKYLRDLPKSGSGGMIVGRVDESIQDYSKENLRAKAMTNARVKAAEIDGEKREFVGTTDKNGYFEIKVPPGRYRVKPELPDDLMYNEGYYGIDREPLKIEDQRCAISTFWVMNNSEIGGKIVDSAGKPHDDVITLDIVPADLREGENDNGRSEFVVADGDGTFSKKGLPAGRYLLVINYQDSPEDDTPYPTSYYPNTRKFSEAVPIVIGAGTKVQNLTFVLPPKLVKRTFTGIVAWDDGKPATGIELDLIDIESDQSGIFYRPVTNARGEFSIEWFEGRNVKLRAVAWQKTSETSKAGIAHGESEEFVISGSTPKIRIVMSKLDPKMRSLIRTTVRAN